MGFEEVVQQILSSRQDLSHEELLEMISEKKQEAERFFTDEAAARLVALELGVEIALKPHRLQASIGDLVSGLGDVTVTGRITEIHHPQTFTRQDQTEGKLARLVIKDRSGTVRAVLWDDKANLVEAGTVKLGRIVKIAHGYVREGLDGKPELHLGSRGQLEVSPLDTAEEAPPVTLSKIGKLGRGTHDVDVLARVVRVGDTREFRRSTDDVGYVATLLIRDETGYTRLNLWEERASISREIKEN
jgi:replication factor A1